MNITVKNEERLGKANNLLNIFCHDHANSEPHLAHFGTGISGTLFILFLNQLIILNHLKVGE